MKPPSNDPSRTSSAPSSPSDGAGKVEPGKVEPGKSEAGKPDPAPGAAAADATTPPPSKAEPSKEGGPGAKPDATKPDAGQPPAGASEPGEAAGPSPARPETSKPDTAKADATKPGGFTAGPQSGARTAEMPVDGPIIDLKARRIPEPAAAATGPKASGPRIGDSNPKIPDPKASEAKATDPKAASPDGEAKPEARSASDGRGGGFGAGLAAGLIGGVVGAGLLFAVERTGIVPGGSGELATRVTALGRSVDLMATRDSVASLDKRVSADEAALKPLSDSVRNAEAAAREALQKATSAPASAPADGAAPAVPADLAARIDSLDQRVSALQEEPGRDPSAEARASVAQGGPSAEQWAKLDERIKAVEGRVDGAAKPAGQPDVGARLAALQGEIESRGKASAEADQALTQKLSALQSTLDERVKTATVAVQTATEASRQATEAGKVQAEEAAKAVARQIQAQADRIAGLDKALSERAEVGTVQAALQVVSADRIATALATGAPYADALAALRNLEPGDPARLNAVAVFADRGAPTARTLAAEFRSIAATIAASRKAAQARSVAETGDIGQRLMSMAESIVQVRKVDTPAAGKASAADPVAQVQAALDRGAVAEAAEAFAAMPESLRNEAGEFGTKLASRAAAGKAAQALLADAFKGLSAPASAR